MHGLVIKFEFKAIYFMQDGENLLIPLHGYPVVADVQLPSNVDMGAVPLSDTKIKRFPLSCSIPIDFDFTVSVVTSHPFFTVSPEHGVIPAKGSADLVVAFTPENYTTSTFAFELLIAQFNAKPMRCTITGTSTPGLHKAAHIQALTVDVAPTPPKAERKIATKVARSSSAQKVVQETAADVPLVVDGVVIPKSLSTTHQVNMVLNQPSLDGLNARVVLNEKMDAALASREARQEAFQAELRALARRTGRGDSEIADEARRDVIALRRKDEDQYTAAQGRGTTVEAIAFARTVTYLDTFPARTHRRIDEASQAVPALTFISDPTSDWKRRSEMLHKFIAAARTVCCVMD